MWITYFHFFYFSPILIILSVLLLLIIIMYYMEKKNRISSYTTEQKKGFTLLELLIVIGILVILSAVVIFVLNPAETLRKSRDSQRIADLATIKSALGLYLTSVATPLLDNTSANPTCRGGAGTPTLYYSYPSDSPGANITDITLDGTNFTQNGQVLAASNNNVNGTGWLPVNLSSLAGGSPISNMPVDPTNTVSTAGLTAMTTSELVYRYGCDAADLTFETDAHLESTAFTTDPDNRQTKDGGNNSNVYEVGTKLSIIGAGADF